MTLPSLVLMLSIGLAIVAIDLVLIMYNNWCSKHLAFYNIGPLWTILELVHLSYNDQGLVKSSLVVTLLVIIIALLAIIRISIGNETVIQLRVAYHKEARIKADKRLNDLLHDRDIITKSLREQRENIENTLHDSMHKQQLLNESAISQRSKHLTMLEDVMIEKSISSYYSDYIDEVSHLTTAERTDALYAILHGRGTKFRSICHNAKKRNNRK